MAVCGTCGAEGEGKFCGTCGGPMPQKRALARGEGSPFATHIAGVIPAGSTITVGARDKFYGLRFGSCEVIFEKGAHVVSDDLEGGWLIGDDGMDVPFEEDLGVMQDTKDNKGKIVVRGVVRVKIDEPKDFIVWSSEDLDVVALATRVKSKVRELFEAKLADMLAGERYLTSFQSSKMIDAMKKEVLAAWTGDMERDAFAAIELPKVEVRVTTITDPPPPPSAPEPAVAAPPATPSFGPGARVDVMWGDGGRYSATVRASGCLVTFDDGQEHWIPLENLAEPAKP